MSVDFSNNSLDENSVLSHEQQRCDVGMTTSLNDKDFEVKETHLITEGHVMQDFVSDLSNGVYSVMLSDKEEEEEGEEKEKEDSGQAALNTMITTDISKTWAMNMHKNNVSGNRRRSLSADGDNNNKKKKHMKGRETNSVVDSTTQFRRSISFNSGISLCISPQSCKRISAERSINIMCDPSCTKEEKMVPQLSQRESSYLRLSQDEDNNNNNNEKNNENEDINTSQFIKSPVELLSQSFWSPLCVQLTCGSEYKNIFTPQASIGTCVNMKLCQEGRETSNDYLPEKNIVLSLNKATIEHMNNNNNNNDNDMKTTTTTMTEEMPTLDAELLEDNEMLQIKTFSQGCHSLLEISSMHRKEKGENEKNENDDDKINGGPLGCRIRQRNWETMPLQIQLPDSPSFTSATKSSISFGLYNNDDFSMSKSSYCSSSVKSTLHLSYYCQHSTEGEEGEGGGEGGGSGLFFADSKEIISSHIDKEPYEKKEEWNYVKVQKKNKKKILKPFLYTSTKLCRLLTGKEKLFENSTRISHERHIHNRILVPSLKKKITTLSSDFGAVMIFPGFFLGSYNDAFKLEALASHGISLVLNMAEECAVTEEMRNNSYHIIFIHIPLKDHSDENIAPYFEPLTYLIHQQLHRRERSMRTTTTEISSELSSETTPLSSNLPTGGVLVHCRVGISRSVAIVLAYLMIYGDKLTIVDTCYNQQNQLENIDLQFFTSTSLSMYNSLSDFNTSREDSSNTHIYKNSCSSSSSCCCCCCCCHAQQYYHDARSEDNSKPLRVAKNYRAAFRFVKRRKSDINPNIGFVLALRELEKGRKNALLNV